MCFRPHLYGSVSINSTSQREAYELRLVKAWLGTMFPLIPLPRGKRTGYSTIQNKSKQVSINSTSQREAYLHQILSKHPKTLEVWVSINSTSQREAYVNEVIVTKAGELFPLIPLPRGKRTLYLEFLCDESIEVSINSTSQREAYPYILNTVPVRSLEALSEVQET